MKIFIPSILATALAFSAIGSASAEKITSEAVEKNISLTATLAVQPPMVEFKNKTDADINLEVDGRGVVKSKDVVFEITSPSAVQVKLTAMPELAHTSFPTKKVAVNVMYDELPLSMVSTPLGSKGDFDTMAEKSFNIMVADVLPAAGQYTGQINLSFEATETVTDNA